MMSYTSTLFHMKYLLSLAVFYMVTLFSLITQADLKKVK